MSAKKRNKRISSGNRCETDMPVTPERRRRAGGAIVRVSVSLPCGEKAQVRRVYDQDPLERLFRRGVVDDRQHAAGMRFASDWRGAGIPQKVTSAYSDTPRTRPEFSAMASTEAQVYARQRLRGAREAIGPYLDGIVLDVLIDERDLLDTGRKHFGRRDGPQARASATDVFKIALDMLADHYGL